MQIKSIGSVSFGRSSRYRSVSPRASLAAIERYVLQTLARSQNQVLLLWIVGGTTTLAVAIWNWRLVLATGSGIGAMAFAYWLQQQDLRQLWQRWQQYLLRGAQRQLVWATVCGGSTALGTYLMTSVWLTTENHWLAAASLLQGTGILTLLALAGWQLLQQSQYRTEYQYDRLIWALSAPQPLKRLMAVQQLSRQYRRYARSQQAELKEYFCLLLTDESHPQVRAALLTALDRIQSLEQEQSPLPLPRPLEARSAHHHLSELPEDFEPYARSRPQQRRAHVPHSNT